MIGTPLNFLLVTSQGITTKSRPYATLEHALVAFSAAVADGATYAKVTGPLHAVYALHGEE